MAREAYPDDAVNEATSVEVKRAYVAHGIALERARIAAWLREGGTAADAGNLAASNAIVDLVYSLDPR